MMHCTIGVNNTIQSTLGRHICVFCKTQLYHTYLYIPSENSRSQKIITKLRPSLIFILIQIDIGKFPAKQFIRLPSCLLCVRIIPLNVGSCSVLLGCMYVPPDVQYSSENAIKGASPYEMVLFHAWLASVGKACKST